MTRKFGPWFGICPLLIIIVVICICSNSVNAKTTIEFKLMSPGHELVLKDGTRVQYYLLEEYLQLAEFDAELLKLRADSQDLEGLSIKLKLQLEEKDKIILGLEDDKSILTKRGLRLQEGWDKCEEEVIELSGGTIWPYVVGVAGVVVGAVGVGMWVGSH